MRLEGGGSPLEDDCRLSSYTDMKSGANIYLIIQPPWVVYIDDPENGKTYEIEIPSKDPQVYTSYNKLLTFYYHGVIVIQDIRF